MSTRTNETIATDELMAYAEANAGRGDDCGRLARMVVDRFAAAAAPVFEVGFGWLDDAAKYGRGTKLYARPCTCNPDDNPPKPCAQQFALTDCRTADATRWRETGEEDPHNGQQVLAAIRPYNNPDNGWLIVHAVYTDGRWICPAEHTSLHAPGYWMPAPALPDGA